jgi:ribosomal protein S3AE
MAKKTLKKKGKKEWYQVIAPDAFKNKELGEILAYEPKDLVGKHFRRNYAVLTGNPRDKSKNFTLRITEVIEKKARTEPVKVIYGHAYVQRASGRSKTRMLHVGKYNTIDNKTVNIKLYLLGRNKIVRSVNTALLKQTDSLLKSRLAKAKYTSLFEPNYLESLSKEIKSKLRTIYPLSNILFWKVIVLD